MGFLGTLGTERGQTSPLGVALVVAIVIVGSVSVVVLGSTALSSTEHSAEVGQAEHTMSQFDSLAAQVALGDSPVQSLRVGQGAGGGYHTEPDSGRIVIIHTNFSGTSDDHEIYNATMGSVVYENGEDAIAYQGGGVWRKRSTGESVMVSPPEFHYREATLTFPVIRVTQGGTTSGASGMQTITVRRPSDVTEIFPNRNSGYPDTDDDDDGFVSAAQPYNGSNDGDGDGGAYSNPQENGTIVVKVSSEYYKGWEEYFRDRTSGNVTVYDANQTVHVELISLGTGTGDFSMPPEGSPIEVRGLKPEGHALDSFEIELRPDQTDSANFANLQWSLFADQGDKEFEIHLKKGSSADCGSQTVDVSMYYSEDNGDTYHGWKSEDAVTVQCDGDDNALLVLDLAQLSSNLTYQELSSDDMQVVKPQQGTLVSTATVDGHSGISWEPSSYSTNDEQEVGRLFAHYMALLGPSIDLEVRDSSNDGISESASSGSINYEGTGQFVTFLHVSENEIEVEFD
jgi:type II secretory pathway pseudopilin PulG